MIPDILFALHRDADFEDTKAILREANAWLASNPTSAYFNAVQSAKVRLGTRLVNTYLINILDKETV